MQRYAKFKVEMREDPKIVLLFVIVLAVAMLPIHAEQALGAHSAAQSIKNHSHDSDATGCDHSGNTNTLDADACGGDAHAEGAVDDCCGDHCTSTQILLPTLFNFQQSPKHYYHPAWSQWLPDPIVSAEFRPPITRS